MIKKVFQASSLISLALLLSNIALTPADAMKKNNKKTEDWDDKPTVQKKVPSKTKSSGKGGGWTVGSARWRQNGGTEEMLKDYILVNGDYYPQSLLNAPYHDERRQIDFTHYPEGYTLVQASIEQPPYGRVVISLFKTPPLIPGYNPYQTQNTGIRDVPYYN